MLSVIMVNVMHDESHLYWVSQKPIMLSVVMLNVVAP